MVAGGNRKGPGPRRICQHGPGGHDTHVSILHPLTLGQDTMITKPLSGPAMMSSTWPCKPASVAEHLTALSTDPQKSRHHLIIDRNNVCNDHHRLSPQVDKMI